MVVFGLGGIGLNVVQGARLAGADEIIGVDLNPGESRWRASWADPLREPEAARRDLVAHLVELTGGGADYSFECVGDVTLMRQALECCHRGWGVSVIIGVAGAGKEIATAPVPAGHRPRLEGDRLRRARGRTDVPRIVDWYMEGKIDVDSLITHKLPLARINEAFDLMYAGTSIRTVVEFDDDRDDRTRDDERAALFRRRAGLLRAQSAVCGGPMRFAVYQPPAALRGERVPVLYYLAGLTCTDETFAIKSGAQRVAAELGWPWSPATPAARDALAGRRRGRRLRPGRRILPRRHRAPGRRRTRCTRT